VIDLDTGGLDRSSGPGCRPGGLTGCTGCPLGLYRLPLVEPLEDLERMRRDFR